MPHRTNLPKVKEISEQEFHNNLVLGLARAAINVGRGNLADKTGRTTRAIDNIFNGTNNGSTYKALLDLLGADLTVLDEVLALYGVGLHRLPDSSTGGRGEMLTNLIDFAAAVNTDQREGNADHRARIKLADKARPVVQDAMGVIREADRLRGVA